MMSQGLRRLALAFSLALAWTAAAAGPNRPDLATAAGFRQTCEAMPLSPARLRNDDERIAFVGCRDTALVKQITTRLLRGIRQMTTEKPSEEGIVAAIREEVDCVRDQLGRSRAVLEKLRLGKRQSLRVVPAKWELDLDGDGRIEVREKCFFVIPRRGRHSFGFSLPSNSLDHYIKEYNLDAAIRVDQSDVSWALAYHRLFEGLLVNSQAFEIDFKGKGITLARPAKLGTAHALLNGALLNSEQMRRSEG